MKAEIATQNGIAGAPAVLVVEDEAIIRMLLVEGLEDAGFAVMEADGADAAVAIVSNGTTIRAVVTDVRMPGSMDGFGLAAWMRENAPHVPIIITSGLAAEPDCEAINPAIACVIQKPYSLKKVVGLLVEVLG